MSPTYRPALLLGWLLLAIPASPALAQGIAFFDGTWAEALEAAAREDKLLFVDAYATWCGPCKRMDREVFNQKEVGDYFNRHFINVKLDMERGEGLVFRETYPVSAFPTLYFINPGGETVHRAVGAQNVEGLLRLGRFALSKNDDSGDYARRYEEGERDPAFILKYITALNKAGKPSLRIVNAYLQTRKNPDEEIDLRILFEGATEADSRAFELFLARRPAMEKLFPPQQVAGRIEQACTATLMKAVEFQVASLHQLAVETMRQQLPERAPEFILDADLQYYKGAGELDAYFKACRQYAAAKGKSEPNAVATLAMTLLQDMGHRKEAVKTAEEIAEIAARHATSHEPLMAQAQILKKAGKSKEARKAAEKARKWAADDPRLLQSIDQFIQDI